MQLTCGQPTNQIITYTQFSLMYLSCYPANAIEMTVLALVFVTWSTNTEYLMPFIGLENHITFEATKTLCRKKIPWKLLIKCTRTLVIGIMISIIPGASLTEIRTKAINVWNRLFFLFDLWFLALTWIRVLCKQKFLFRSLSHFINLQWIIIWNLLKN